MIRRLAVAAVVISVASAGLPFVPAPFGPVAPAGATGAAYIVTVAGGGALYPGDGWPGTLASVSPFGLAHGADGSLYFADFSARVRKLSPDGIVTTIAGNGAQGFNGDGNMASSAKLYDPRDVALDSAGNVYIADSINRRIRKVAASTGLISTVAGGGGSLGDGGPATSADINRPRGIALDAAGNLYISDTDNHRIRKVTASTGVITTIAGTGSPGNTGDGGAATAAALNYPVGIEIDGGGNVYFTQDAVVRKVSATGTISRVAGNGQHAFSGDGGPATSASLWRPGDVAVDSTGNLYIADDGNRRVRYVAASTGTITTIAGNGSDGSTGDGGLATAAGMTGARSVMVDTSGTFHVVDGGRIRKIAADLGGVPVPAGLAFANQAQGFPTAPQTTTFVNAGIAAVSMTSVTITGADAGDFAKVLDACTGTTIQPAGQCAVSVTFTPSAKGPRVAQLRFTDSGSNSPQLVHLGGSATGVITTVAGTGSGGYNGDGLAGTATNMNPYGIAFDGGGDLYFAESSNQRVRKLKRSGFVAAVAGTGGSGFSGDGGPATSAQFRSPSDVAIDTAGNAYIADTDNHRIRKVSASTGTITTVAGGGGSLGDGGPATSANLYRPQGIAVDAAGNLYISDTGQHRVRKVTAATGVITTIAGTGAAGYGGDTGIGTAAQVDTPMGVAVDSTGNVYFAQQYNSAIRKVTASTGIISTIAGTSRVEYNGDDGPAVNASFWRPVDVSIDRAGTLYATDQGGRRVRVISGGTITTVAGNGTDTFSGDNGLATSAGLSSPVSVATDASGSIYVTSDGRVRKIAWSPVGGALSEAESRGGSNPSEACVCDAVPNATSYPITTSTGNFWHTFADLTIPGRGPALAFSHTYNSSAAAGDGPLGFGWTHPYAMSLAIGTSGTPITVNQENGSQVTFTASGTSYTAPPRVAATLVHNADGTYTFTRRARQVFTFDANGRLTAERDLNGNTTSLAYNGSGQLATVSDAGGRTLTLTYTGGRLTTLADPSTPPRQVTFGYDGSGNLTDVVQVDGGHWQFTYDGSHRLLTMRSPRFYGDSTTTPTPVVTNHYDSSGRIDWQTDPLGRQTTFAYGNGTTTVTDPAGHVTVDQFENGVLVAQTRGSGTPQAATWTYAYDSRTLGITAVRDPNGHTTSRSYDQRGNVLTRTDALGNTTSFTYNTLDQPLTVTDPLGVATTNAYDAAGNLTSSARPLLDSNSNTISTATTTYTRNDPSHPEDVTSITDPLGKVWSFTHDAYGNLTSETAPPTPENAAGNRTTYGYDTTRGWRTSMVSPKGNLSGANPANHTTTYAYDLAGRPTLVRDPLWTAASPTQHQTTRHYDANGNLDSSTDGNNRTTTFVYDAAEQLTTVTRADGTIRRTEYWPDGTVHRQRDGTDQATTYTYDGQARLATASDPLSRTTSYGYDGTGNLLTVVDPSSRTTTYTYDAANRTKTIGYSDGVTPNVTNIGYDANGRRTSMTDGTGTSTWVWDSLGRLLASTNGAGRTVGYGYDLRGQATSIAYPNSAGTVTRTYDAAGRLSTVSDWLSHTTTFVYDADSNLTNQTYPNTTSTTFAHDRADRLMGIDHTRTGSSFSSFTYGRDGADLVSSVTSTGVPSDNHSYGYSLLNQLTTVDSASYGYDAADNLTALVDGSTQQFDVANQLTSSTNVSLVGTANAGDGGSASSLTIPLPGGAAANDQILVAATLAKGKTVNTPAGYTVVGTYTSGTSNTSAKVVVYRRTAVVGDANVTVTFGSNVAKAVTVAVYRGIDTTAPIDVSSSGSTAGGTSVTMPSVTTTHTGDRLVLFAGATTAGSASSWTGPASMTTRVQQAGGTSVGAAVADEPLGAAGATGTRAAAYGVSAQLVGVLVALKPLRTTYGYDPQGNRTTITPAAGSGSGTTLAYNQANRLTGYGSSATYAYDGNGLRASKTVSGSTTPFTWDESGGLPLLLADGTTYYVYGPGGRPLEQINGSTVLYFHSDQLGSTRALTDSAGSVVATYTYDAYGRPVGSTGTVANPFRFAGEYHDNESGLVYLRARYYEPSTGQFLTRDPAEASTGSPYAYVYGDPLNGADPSGLWGFNIPEWVPGVGGMCFSNEPSCENPHSGHSNSVSRAVVDVASGVLEVNPITATTNALGLTDTSQYADPCSGWYEVGKWGMAAVDIALAGGAGRAVAVANKGRLAGSKAVGKSSATFGRARYGRQGALNHGPVRIGWGWKGTAQTGTDVFRIAVGTRGTRWHRHLDLF